MRPERFPAAELVEGVAGESDGNLWVRKRRNGIPKMWPGSGFFITEIREYSLAKPKDPL
jgi:hypothetical protein